MKILLALLSCIALFSCGDPEQAVIKTLEPGDTAPGFSLKNIDEKMVSLADYPDAKAIIVVFTANTCPVAIKYEDRIIALANKYKARGYPVIAINPNPPRLFSGETFERMQEKAKLKGFGFPYLFDDGQKVTNQYGARVTPHFFLLKKEGVAYMVRYTGALDNDTWDRNDDKTLYIEDAIKALEAGQSIKLTTTKAIGCAVKRP